MRKEPPKNDDDTLKYSETNRWHASWNAIPPKGNKTSIRVTYVLLAGISFLVIYFGFFYEEKRVTEEVLYRPLKETFAIVKEEVDSKK